MIRILRSIIMMLSMSMLFACSTDGAKPSGNINQFKLTATVEKLGDKIEVNVTEGEYASGIYWVIVADNAKLYGKRGERISTSDIKVGDTVEIIYNGQVMMSYPPQIVAIQIRQL